MNRYTDAGDIDLDLEYIRRPDGTRLTEKAAAELGRDIADRGAAEDARRGRGRPSLSGSDRSPQLGVRLPAYLHARLLTRAEDEDRKVSELVREALEQYLGTQGNRV